MFTSIALKRMIITTAALATAFAAHAGVTDTDENGFYKEDVLCGKISVMQRVMDLGGENINRPEIFQQRLGSGNIPK